MSIKQAKLSPKMQNPKSESSQSSPIDDARMNFLKAVETMQSEKLFNVRSLNKDGAYIRNIGKIYRPKLSDKTGVDTFSTVKDFKDEFMNREKVTESVIKSERGKITVKKVDAGTGWLNHPDRLTYDAIMFNPFKNGDYDGIYNKFKGLPWQACLIHLRPHTLSFCA